MKIGHWAIAAMLTAVMIGCCLSTYFYVHRFKVTSSGKMVYVVDTWDGDIKVFAVGDEGDARSIGKLKVFRVAALLDRSDEE